MFNRIAPWMVSLICLGGVLLSYAQNVIPEQITPPFGFHWGQSEKTIETIIALGEQWAIQETEAEIERHQRAIAKLKRQHKFITGVIATYRKSVADADKRMKEDQKKWNKRQREDLKRAAERFGAPLVTGPVPYPIGVAVPPAPRKERRRG